MGLVKGLPEADFYILGSTPTVHDQLKSKDNEIYSPTLNALTSIEAGYKNKQTRAVNLPSGAAYSASRDIDLPRSESSDIGVLEEDIYAKSKFEVEKILSSENSENELSYISLRIFSLYGPGLPTDKHFAIWNFIESIYRKKPILLAGSPAAKRSYLHVGDLVHLIMKTFNSNFSGPINVGGTQSLSIGELCNTLCKLFDHSEVIFEGRDTQSNYYYPDTSLSRKLFGQYELTGFNEGLIEWKTWIQSQDQNS